jgi:lipoprotein signal peptidase
MTLSSEKTYRKVLWTLVILGTCLDQTTKYGVFKWLYTDAGQGKTYDLIPGVFQFVAQSTKEPVPAGVLADLRAISGPTLPYVNEGALFGLGQEYKGVANSVFTIVSVVAAVAMICWSRRPATAQDPALCLALGLILAGTLGNLYDRLIFAGVRDFLHFYWFRFPVFNVADCCLVFGAFLLLAQAFFQRPAPVAQANGEMALAAAANASRQA